MEEPSDRGRQRRVGLNQRRANIVRDLHGRGYRDAGTSGLVHPPPVVTVELLPRAAPFRISHSDR